MKTTLISFIALGVLLSAASCAKHFEQTLDDPSRGLRVAGTDSGFVSLPRRATFESSPETTEDFLAASGKIFNTMVVIPKGYDPRSREPLKLRWREINPRVAAFLGSVDTARYASYYRQMCALEMLCGTDLMTDPSDDALPVVAHYVNLLSQEENGSVVVYYHALNRLKNYWSVIKRRDIARRAIRAGERATQESKTARTKLQLNGEWKDMYLKGEKIYEEHIARIRKAQLE